MSNGSRGGGFLEQYERTLRWFEQFKRISEGQEHTQNSDHYEDIMRAFFENCYHLKDWIKNDPQSKIPPQDIEDFINNTPSMRICADIANSQKHLRLSPGRERSQEDPTPGPRHFTLSLGGGPPYGQVSYTISTLSGPLDAFHLARECVDAWKAFLGQHGHST